MQKPNYLPINYLANSTWIKTIAEDEKIDLNKYHFIKLQDDGFALLNKSTLLITYIHQSMYQHISTNDRAQIGDDLFALLLNDISDDKLINENQPTKINKIFLHISHDCNLSCPYCYALGGDYGKGRKMMTLETAVKAINYIIARDPSIEELTIEFFGGEPLLNHNTIENLIEYIEKHFTDISFKYGCVTNATVMNDKIYSMLKKYNFNVMMTIDGPQYFHDQQRIYANGKGSFEDVLKNITLFKESVSNLSVRIVYTKLNQNLYDIYKYVYEELGITNVSFRPVMTEIEKFKLSSGDIKKASEEIRKCFLYYLEKKLQNKKITTSLFDDIVKSLLYRKRKEKFCDFGNFVSITPEGDIYPCTHFVYNDKYKFGSINDSKLDEDAISYCLNSGMVNYTPCAECWMKNLCQGGCKGSAEFYYKNIYTKDEFCETRQVIVEQAVIEIVKSCLNDNINKLYDAFKLVDSDNLISADRWR